MQKIANIFWLGTKELRSFLHDYVLLALVIYAFSSPSSRKRKAIRRRCTMPRSASSTRIIRELSRRITRAFLPPYFQMARPIAERDIVPLMNSGSYTFVVDIPPNFARDVLAGRHPAIQLNVDATAMVQAGLGSDYAQQIIMTEINDFLSRAEGAALSPVNLVVRIEFNPNVETSWFTSVMGIINIITMLAIVLSGAAIVREREHGTMDHLLVMPLTPFEIAMAKIWANGLVIVVAVGALALSRRARVAPHSDRRVGPAVHGRRGGISVFCHCGRNFPWHHSAFDAAARPALYACLHAAGDAFWQQYAAREHAAMARDDHAGITDRAFRFVRAGDPLSRRRPRRCVAAVRHRRADRRAIFGPRLAALPQGHRCCDVRPAPTASRF